MKFPAWLGVFVCSTAMAGIEWEQSEISMNAKPGDDHVEAVFHFKNTGKKPVTIRDAQPTCDCLAVETGLHAYAPGESGEVRATFYIEHHLGEHRKGIEVLTDDPKRPQQVLFFTVFIGDSALITPTALKWRAGGERDPQSIHFVVTQKAPLRIVSAECDGAGWKAGVREVRPGREYFVSVTPPATGTRAASEVTIKTDSTEDHAKAFTAGLSVE